MNPPFTLDEFLEVFKEYNQTVFPMQIVLYFVSALAIYLAIKPNPKSDRIISVLLSLLWLWMGIVYHIIFFTAVNVAAYLFGGLFITQGILFFVFGVVQDKFRFQFKRDLYGIVGMILIVFALIIYPALGLSLGHTYPYSPSFGLPCPTSIFTFGVLLFNVKRWPVAIFIIPFLWSVIGFAAVFQFGILQDTSLIVASLITLSLLIYRNRLGIGGVDS